MSLNSIEETASQSNPFVKHGPQEQALVDAIRITTERDGGLWLASTIEEHDRSHLGQELERQIIARGRKIDFLRMHAVRLAAFMHACDGSGYLNVLYGRIPRLRAAYFREIATASTPRLGADFAADSKRVRFLSVGLALHGKAFSLTFEQMPLVAGFLDFLHNALGFGQVEERLKPLFRSLQQPDAADKVDAALKDDLEQWFKDKLRSEHYIGKARQIRKFLSDLASQRVRPPSLLDNIDDEAIFSFWDGINSQTPDISSRFGFLLYGSAAQAMLDYRAAIILSSRKENMEGAEALVDQDGNEIELVGNDGRETLEGDADAGAHVRTEEWFSPLVPLLTPPCDRVSWIIGRDLKLASAILPEASASNTLFRNDRPDPRFYLTILRYLYFGKNKKTPSPREQEYLGTNYDSCKINVRNLVCHLKVLLQATAQVLLLRSSTAALAILEEIEPGLVKRLEPALGIALARAISEREQRDVDPRFIQVGTKVLLGKIAGRLLPISDSGGKQSAEDPAGMRLKSARDKVKRAGFRPEDDKDPSFDEPLEAGAAYLIPLITEIERISGWFYGRDLDALFAGDARRFEAVFSTLYQSG